MTACNPADRFDMLQALFDALDTARGDTRYRPGRDLLEERMCLAIGRESVHELDPGDRRFVQRHASRAYALISGLDG
jgi:hypothetical protein